MHSLACSANGRQADKHTCVNKLSARYSLVKAQSCTSKFGSFLGNCHSRKKGSVYDNEMTSLFDHTV